MARSVDLTTLRARVRRAGSWENATGRVSDAELDDAINEGIAEIWEAIVNTGKHWKRSESSAANTASGTQAYALGATVYLVLSVKMTISGRESSLTPIDEISMPEVGGQLYATTGQPRHYTIAGDYLLFSPIPDGAYSYKYAFVPCATKLVNPGDNFDGINGWERGVVYAAVREIAFKQKEWELADRADGIVAKVKAQIQTTGVKRDPLPATMVDLRGLERRNKKWLWR